MDNNSEVKKLKFTSIIIVTYNNLEYTKACIESIKNFTKESDYEIIVVDNNSTDSTVEWLKSQAKLITIFNEKNEGFAIACNQGIKISKGDNILLLHNDAIVTPLWLDNLQSALYSEESIGAVGPVFNIAGNSQQIEYKYNDLNEMLKIAKSHNTSADIKYKLKVKLLSICLLIKRDVIDKIGLFDEQFKVGYFEEDDICYRMIYKGYKLLLSLNTFVHHAGGASFLEYPDATKIHHENAKKFKDKWDFDAAYSSSIRGGLIELIEEELDSELNILEVGCGVGASLLELKNIYPYSNLYGIEISSGAGKIASCVTDCIIGDIETIELTYKEKYFDYMILGDVLEHLNNPWDTINKLSKYLKDGGYIIASIPNVMHISVLSLLIRGYFDYEESGILDKTHLRFFTGKSVEDLFKNNDFSIEYLDSTYVYISKENENLITELCKKYGEQLKHQYLTYQYIVKAKLNVEI